MRLLTLCVLVMGVGLCGCSGKSSDETEAEQALKVKPLTEQQKQNLEKVKKSNPVGSAHAGVPGGKP